MNDIGIKNSAILCGILDDAPRFSHESRGERFFTFPLQTYRLSGAADTINVLARESLLSVAEITEGARIKVSGELRSFNNKRGEGAKLIITVFAREVLICDDEDKNSIELSGTICKPPNQRVTPMGREICDLMLAVSRNYGRSDYLPCICWGSQAKKAALWDVGDSVKLSGRIQSRSYIKLIDGLPIEKVAFEVSVMEIEKICTVEP